MQPQNPVVTAANAGNALMAAPNAPGIATYPAAQPTLLVPANAAIVLTPTPLPDPLSQSPSLAASPATGPPMPLLQLGASAPATLGGGNAFLANGSFGGDTHGMPTPSSVVEQGAGEFGEFGGSVATNQNIVDVATSLQAVAAAEPVAADAAEMVQPTMVAVEGAVVVGEVADEDAGEDVSGYNPLGIGLVAQSGDNDLAPRPVIDEALAQEEGPGAPQEAAGVFAPAPEAAIVPLPASAAPQQQPTTVEPEVTPEGPAEGTIGIHSSGETVSALRTKQEHLEDAVQATLRPNASHQPMAGRATVTTAPATVAVVSTGATASKEAIALMTSHVRSELAQALRDEDGVGTTVEAAELHHHHQIHHHHPEDPQPGPSTAGGAPSEVSSAAQAERLVPDLPSTGGTKATTQLRVNVNQFFKDKSAEAATGTTVTENALQGFQRDLPQPDRLRWLWISGCQVPPLLEASGGGHPTAAEMFGATAVVRPHVPTQPEFAEARLTLLYYTSFAHESETYNGRLERPPDLKLGGVLGDVKALTIANMVVYLTGIEVEAADMFSRKYGRCNLWLRDPSKKTDLIKALEHRFWMAPMAHNYAVAVDNPEGREYLLWYLEGLRTNGPKKVMFPRHLVTCDHWIDVQQPGKQRPAGRNNDAASEAAPVAVSHPTHQLLPDAEVLAANTAQKGAEGGEVPPPAGQHVTRSNAKGANAARAPGQKKQRAAAGDGAAGAPRGGPGAAPQPKPSKQQHKKNAQRVDPAANEESSGQAAAAPRQSPAGDAGSFYHQGGQETVAPPEAPQPYRNEAIGGHNEVASVQNPYGVPPPTPSYAANPNRESRPQQQQRQHRYATAARERQRHGGSTPHWVSGNEHSSNTAGGMQGGGSQPTYSRERQQPSSNGAQWGRRSSGGHVPHQHQHHQHQHHQIHTHNHPSYGQPQQHPSSMAEPPLHGSVSFTGSAFDYPQPEHHHHHHHQQHMPHQSAPTRQGFVNTQPAPGYGSHVQHHGHHHHHSYYGSTGEVRPQRQQHQHHQQRGYGVEDTVEPRVVSRVSHHSASTAHPVAAAAPPFAHTSHNASSNWQQSQPHVHVGVGPAQGVGEVTVGRPTRTSMGRGRTTTRM